MNPYAQLAGWCDLNFLDSEAVKCASAMRVTPDRGLLKPPSEPT